MTTVGAFLTRDRLLVVFFSSAFSCWPTFWQGPFSPLFLAPNSSETYARPTNWFFSWPRFVSPKYRGDEGGKSGPASPRIIADYRQFANDLKDDRFAAVLAGLLWAVVTSPVTTGRLVESPGNSGTLPAVVRIPRLANGRYPLVV